MTNQDLFKQAIADAKSVRDAAVANAKAALEETFTPSIMNMLNNKLNEMEDDMEKKEGMKEKEEGYSMEEAKGKPQIIVPANDAYDLDEEAEYFKEMLSDAGIMADVKAGFGELEIYLTNPMEKRKATKVINDAGYSLDEGMKEKEEGYSMEEMDLEEILAELEKEEGKMEEGKKEEVEEAKETEEKGKKKVEEAEDKETMEEADGDDEITELTVDELKDMIRDVLEDVLGGAEEEAGEEEMEAGEEESEESEEAEDEESIDLEELLAELDSMEEGKEKEKVEEKKEKDGEKVEEAKKKEVEEAKKEAKKAKEELEEAIKVIKFLKKELNEVNLLNAKNTYVNKIFKAKSLSESQKVNILKNMDKATNVKEAKVIYESLVSTLSTSKKNSIKESIGFASKAAGVAPKQPIVESDAAIRRMQQLAGIIK
jgi:hypothetical protein